MRSSQTLLEFHHWLHLCQVVLKFVQINSKHFYILSLCLYFKGKFEILFLRISVDAFALLSLHDLLSFRLIPYYIQNV